MVGATTGFSQLWLLLLSTPMMIAVQNTIMYSYCDRKKVTIFMILVLAGIKRERRTKDSCAG
jgi:hypothetical protein